MKIKVTKKDKIIDKLIGIGTVAHKGREYQEKGDLINCERMIKEVMKTTEELWLMWRTDEAKGRKLIWWE